VGVVCWQVTGSVDETVKTWRASGDTCEETHTYTGHALGVVSVAVDARGLTASSALDSVIRVWDMTTNETRAVMEAPPAEVRRPVHIMRQPSFRSTMWVSPHTHTHITWVSGGVALLIRLASGVQVWAVAFDPHTEGARTLAAAGGAGACVSLFSLETKDKAATLSLPPPVCILPASWTRARSRGEVCRERFVSAREAHWLSLLHAVCSRTWCSTELARKSTALLASGGDGLRTWTNLHRGTTRIGRTSSC
jgi:WD40 repeat protein